MRKLAIALGVTAAVALAGGFALNADAASWGSGTLGLPSAAKHYSPVERAACYGPGRWCPTGWVRRCGPWKCKCVPCW